MTEPQKTLPSFEEQAFTVAAHSELIDLLTLLCPEQYPNRDDTEREVWMKAGERRLVCRLNALRERGGGLRYSRTVS